MPRKSFRSSPSSCAISRSTSSPTPQLSSRLRSRACDTSPGQVGGSPTEFNVFSCVSDTSPVQGGGSSRTKLKQCNDDTGLIFLHHDVGKTRLPYTFKSRSATSQRTQIAGAIFAGAIAPPANVTRSMNHNRSRRAKKKKTMMASLSRPMPLPTQVYHPPVLPSTRPQFFLYKSYVRNAVTPPTSVPLNANIVEITEFNSRSMKIIDSTDGAIFHTPEGEVVFILCPRAQSIDSIGQNSSNDVHSFISLRESVGLPIDRSRGKAHASTSPYKYASVGVKACRSTTGMKWSRVVTDDNAGKNHILNLVRRCEHLISKYSPSNLMRNFALAKSLLDISTMSLRDDSLFGAVSVASDYHSSLHVDSDFFFSMLTVRSSFPATNALSDFSHNISSRPPIAQHFLFPTLGVAVALRPGDHLQFNPRIPHCCGNKLPFYEDATVFLSSMYMKTNITGKNDNNLPLSETEQRAYTAMNALV